MPGQPPTEVVVKYKPHNPTPAAIKALKCATTFVQNVATHNTPVRGADRHTGVMAGSGTHQTYEG